MQHTPTIKIPLKSNLEQYISILLQLQFNVLIAQYIWYDMYYCDNDSMCILRNILTIIISENISAFRKDYNWPIFFSIISD